VRISDGSSVPLGLWDVENHDGYEDEDEDDNDDGIDEITTATAVVDAVHHETVRRTTSLGQGICMTNDLRVQ
jgi:hypothetical protein